MELKTRNVGFQTVRTRSLVSPHCGQVRNVLTQLEAVDRKSAQLSSAYARLFVEYYKARPCCCSVCVGGANVVAVARS